MLPMADWQLYWTPTWLTKLLPTGKPILILLLFELFWPQWAFFAPVGMIATIATTDPDIPLHCQLSCAPIWGQMWPKGVTEARYGPIGTDRVRSGPSRPTWNGKCQKQKVSESVGLVGKSLVRPVGVLWTTLGPPIGHMEQKSKNHTIITIIIYFPIQPFKGSI